MGERIAMTPTTVPQSYAQQEHGDQPDPLTPPRQGVAPQPIDTSAQLPHGLGSIDAIREEVNDAYEDMRQFYADEPDDVMRKVSGHLARLGEIRKDIVRIEGATRQLKPIRTGEVEPAIEDLWKQYQIASRLLEVRKMDLQVMGGQT